MSSDNANSTERQPAGGARGEKPRRSKLERALVWTVILVLVALTGMEAMAQRGYSKTLEGLETAIDDATEQLTLGDFETEHKNGLTVKSEVTKDGESAILYKWPSLLRRYEMYFTVEPGDEQILATYSTNDEPRAIIRLATVGDPGEDEGGEGGGGGGGGGGPSEAHGDGTGQPSGGSAGRGRGRGGNPLQRLLAEETAAELQLSDEQKAKIQELIDNQQPPDESLSREERIQQFQAKLAEILNEEQLKKYQESRPTPGGDRPERPE
jgi:hypothetical protein